ncbi:MAG: hypothetical protein M1817_004955 [Caeruleum heppii]|nr:MAG: hypothetical protein M1817_004955 [Caeruleum heppii]
MAPLSPASARAIARLRNYVAPPSIYHALPLSRRAAVLVLLFADHRGDLRVVLTERAATLNSYPGQVALPGGKADWLEETPFQTARREAHEEIGLPANDTELMPSYRIEHLCQLPANLAKTEIGVLPCVAFLDTPDSAVGTQVDIEKSLIPRLDAREVAAVFTAPFHNFLLSEDEPVMNRPEALSGAGTDWYQGTWIRWYDTAFRMHHFFVPTAGHPVTTSGDQDSLETMPGKKVVQEHERSSNSRYRVFGLTARILVDAARVAYAEEPSFEHNAHLGDEALITRLLEAGKLPEKRRRKTGNVPLGKPRDADAPARPAKL